MKLATLNNGTRDGCLLIVSRDGTRSTPATGIARTLQDAMDRWDEVESALQARFEALESGQITGDSVDVTRLLSPLPRAYEWIDGSAYVNHVVLVRKARGAEPPATLYTDPLVYQGGSGAFLAPTGDIPHFSEDFGIDFESEVTVVTGDVPMGVRAAEAGKYIRLVMLANDVTLRNIVPAELEKGFGFFVSKPATAFSPFAVTPDELGPSWRDGRLHRRLRTHWNDALFGDPEAGPDMHFSFHDLLAHVCQTRRLCAGTIVGSGTVSNPDPARGASCIAEKRMREKIETGSIQTSFLRFGDRVRIDMLDDAGHNIFGTIDQRVVRAERPA